MPCEPLFCRRYSFSAYQVKRLAKVIVGLCAGVECVPVMTSLQSSQAAGRHLSDLLAAGKLDMRRLHRLLDAGLELDEYSAVLETLQTVARCYQTDAVDVLSS